MTTPADNLTLDEEIAQMALDAEEPIEGLDEGSPEASVEVETLPGPEGGAAFEPPADSEPVTPSDESPVDEATRLKEENAQLRRDADQRKLELETQQFDAEVRQYAEGYAQNLVETYGWSEDQAKAYAESQRKAYVAEYRLGMERKDNLARGLSQEYGVPAASLMVYNTAEEMTQAAIQQGPRDREVQQMKKEIADLKRARVPSQDYNQPAGRTAATSEERLLDQYNAGVRTPETEAAGRRAAGL